MAPDKTILALAAFVILSQAVFASVPDILVTSIDPQPVEPGKDVTIDVTLFNKVVTQDTGDFSVSLQRSFPVILKSSTNDWSTVSLCSGCKVANKYFLSVDPSAVSGTYPVYFIAAQGGVESREQVDVKVQGRPNVIFSSSGDELRNVTPNSQFTALLDVKNIGSGQARQIKIQPDSANFIALGSAIRTLDFLNANESLQVDFDFAASSSLDAGSYAIPFKISFLDYQGNALNTTINLGVRVVNKGEINIQSIKIADSAGGAEVAPGKPFTVVVRLENIGPGDVDYLTADMSCPFNGVKKAFLGQLGKDEDVPAVFELVSPGSGTYACGLSVVYKDDTGTRSFTDKVSVNVSQAGSSVLIIIVILLGISYVFRKRLAAFAKKRIK